MTEDLTQLFAPPLPSAERPLAGMTILLVEDSRFASEAVRLLCLRSGARIRRADSLGHAERHLSTYRPTVALIDLGLPDGSGLDLIRRLATSVPRLAAILATSGDDGLREAALAAGADGFLAKPCTRIAEFQAAVLAAIGRDAAPTGPRPLSGDDVSPDRLAYRDDLAAAARLLSDQFRSADLVYAAQFLSGVARSAKDMPLADAADALGGRIAGGLPAGSALERLAGLVSERLDADARGAETGLGLRAG